MRLVRNGPFGFLVGPNPSGGHSRNGHYGRGLLGGWETDNLMEEIGVGEDGDERKL